jgi:hypothetical protein
VRADFPFVQDGTRRDDEYGRTKPAEPGRWIAVVGVPMEGPLQDIDVRFEARSGRAAPWQWLDVAPARAKARLTGFAPTNIESLMQPPFSTVTLRVEADGLAVDGDLGDLRGTYVKH